MTKNILFLLALLMCCTHIYAASATVVRNASSMTLTGTYRITKELKAANVKIGDGSTIIFAGSGRITGATIKARNLKVVVPDGKTYFNGCRLAGNIINSKLKATNFGCKPDMRTSSKNGWSYKGLPRQTLTFRTGTDNFKAMQGIASFLNGSSGVDFEWNGNFFSAHQASAAIYAPPYIRIEGSSNLVMHGGTLTSGIRFIDCRNTEVYGTSFVGYHGCHAFPAIHTAGNPTKAVTVNGTTYTRTRADGKLEWADNCYYYGSDGTKNIGLAAEGIVFDTSSPQKNCTGINVHDCHFEMRLNGVVMGMKRTNYSQMGQIANASIKNCTFSHIYFQPIGMHAHNVTINNVSGDYALQPIDISTMSHNVTVRGASFTDLFYGPKQEAEPAYAQSSYGNSIENSTFTINRKYLLIGMDSYALNAAEGRVADTFTVKNTTFNFSTDTYGTFVVRTCADRVRFENCALKISLTKQTDSSSPYCILSIFAALATKATSPKVDLVNTDIEINGTSTLSKGKTTHPFAYLFSKVGAKSYAVNITGCNIHGSARVDWSMFEQMESVSISSSQISISGCDTHGYYINAPMQLSINGCVFSGKLGKNSALVGVRSAGDYTQAIANTTVDASVSRLFSTSADKRRTRITGVRVNGTNRLLTK